MKYILSLIISGALVVSGFGQTRNVLVGTNNTVVQPTNFWSADASNARTGLGLGSAATNDETAFQPSSATLSNFSSGNFTVAISNGGTDATNVSDARINLGLGTAATNPASAFQPSSAILSNLASGSGIAITNIAASNIVGAVAVVNGGTGATNAATARTNLGLGATNAVTFGQLSLGSDLVIGDTTTTWGTNNRINYEELRLQGGNWTIDDGSLIIGGGTNLSLYQAQTRTNLGLPWSGLTNTNAATFQASLFGANTNPVLVDTNGEVVSPTNFWQAAPIATTLQNSQPVANATNAATNARLLFLFSLAPSTTGVTNAITLPTNGSTFNGDVATITHAGPTSSVTAIRQLGESTNIITLNQPDESVRFLYRDNQWELMDNISYIEPIYFSGTNAAANAAASRTNLGLGNISTNTYLSTTNTAVIINTNIVVTNGTGLFTNLQTDYFEVGDYIFVSDSTNTNTIVFEVPSRKTNFIHGLGLGPTNSVSFASLAITNPTDNLVASLEGGASGFPLEIYTTDEQLETGYGSNNFAIGVGGFGFQIKYGTNSSDWGYPVLTSVGGTNLLQPSNVTNFRTAIGLGATNDVTFNNVTASGTLTATGTVTATTNLNVGGAINVTNKAETRTNLGIGGGITTNLVLKNGANVDTYMNFSNGILIYGSTVAP